MKHTKTKGCVWHDNAVNAKRRSGTLQVYYDPNEVKYQQLLDCFFAHVDPTTKNRQGGDMGKAFPLVV